MPLGVVITGANANDGQQAGAVLAALVIKPPVAQTSNDSPDLRDLPSASGDGAYGNAPTRKRAQHKVSACGLPVEGKPRLLGSVVFAVRWSGIVPCCVNLAALHGD